jgi:hypothetical protein
MLREYVYVYIYIYVYVYAFQLRHYRHISDFFRCLYSGGFFKKKTLPAECI